MTDSHHPARSSEFLSRLYDREIDDAARSAFEAHRASCKECREAAAAFEGTLAAFRSAPTAPPAADLSARILRKIRTQSPSRRPFGVTFGIDIRWAGVFIAALVVVLISAPALLRRPTLSPAPAPSAIPARILDEPAAAEGHGVGGLGAEAPGGKPRRGPSPPRPPRRLRSRRAEGSVAPSREASADEEKPRVAARRRRPRRPPPPRPRWPGGRRRPSSPGGESDAASSSELAAAPVRLSVRSLDGEGSAPVLSFHPPDERLTAPARRRSSS